MPEQVRVQRHAPRRAEPVALRPVVLRPVRRRSPAGALVGAALIAALSLGAAWFVMGSQLAGGDSGQWVMLARAYRGLGIPDYRDPLAVPPAGPVLVLALWSATGDPYLAPKLAVMAAYAFVCVGVYALGRELWGWLPGLAVGGIAAVGQHFYLRLAVFGALPQLLALGSFACALTLVARRARHPHRRTGLALCLASCGILASHEPTAVIALPVLAATIALLPPRPASLRGLVARTAPVLPALAAAGLYTLLQRGTFEGYVSNEAAYYAKGLGSALQELLALRASSLLLWVAGAVLLLAMLRGAVAADLLRTRREPPPAAGRARAALRRMVVARAERRRDAVLAAWVLGAPVVLLGGAVVALHLARVGTDYPRMFPLMALPALASLGVLVPDVRAAQARTWVPSREARAVGMAGVLLLPTVGSVVTLERGAMGFYSVASPDDLRAALAAVQKDVPRGGVVLTPVREGKWLEGITGRSALFALPAWAIFRPWEWERKEAAETILGASSMATSGLARVALQRNVGAGTAEPLVSAYFQGDLAPVLRLDDAQSKLRGLQPNPPDVPLSRLWDRDEQLQVQAGTALLTQQARGTVGVSHVEVDRRVALADGGRSVDIAVHVAADAVPLQAAWLALRPPDGVTWGLSIDPDAPSDALVDAQLDGGVVHMLVHAGPSSQARLAPDGSGIDVQLTPQPGPNGMRSQADATITIDMAPVGNPKPTLRTLTPAQALDRFGVGWALLPKNSMGAERAAVQGLGFRPVWEDASYTLFQRGGA